MLYIKLFIEREKNIGQSAPECPFNPYPCYIAHYRTLHIALAFFAYSFCFKLQPCIRGE